jgi:branched-chain amino acid transport system permease protein
VAGAALLLLLPTIWPGQRALLVHVLVFGLLAASLDLLVGFTGLPSLGQGAFFAMGGYTAALVSIHVTSAAVVMVLAGVVGAGTLAAVVGWLGVRTRGVYFLMLTLAFSEILSSLALQWTPVTGGSNGLSTSRADLFGILLKGRGDQTTYWYVLAWFAAGYALLRVVVDSPFGRALVGIRENEARMRALGYATVWYKTAAVVISGAVAGLAGALIVEDDRFVDPGLASFETSAFALIMVIIGGVGTLYGPVIGAAVFLYLRDNLSRGIDLFGLRPELGDRWRLAFGALFILFVYVAPRGIGGLGRLLARALPARRAESAAAGDAPVVEL